MLKAAHQQRDAAARGPESGPRTSDPVSEIHPPILFGKREYLTCTENMGSTTSCQTTRNPSDYGPDD